MTTGFPTAAELQVMQLLMDEPRGLYGLQVVDKSKIRRGTQISRGSIYVLLGRLEDKGLVDVDRRKESNYPGMPRPLYKLNAHGQRVLAVAEANGMLTA